MAHNSGDRGGLEVVRYVSMAQHHQGGGEKRDDYDNERRRFWGLDMMLTMMVM